MKMGLILGYDILYFPIPLYNLLMSSAMPPSFPLSLMMVTFNWPSQTKSRSSHLSISWWRKGHPRIIGNKEGLPLMPYRWWFVKKLSHRGSLGMCHWRFSNKKLNSPTIWQQSYNCIKISVPRRTVFTLKGSPECSEHNNFALYVYEEFRTMWRVIYSKTYENCMIPVGEVSSCPYHDLANLTIFIIILHNLFIYVFHFCRNYMLRYREWDWFWHCDRMFYRIRYFGQHWFR